MGNCHRNGYAFIYYLLLSLSAKGLDMMVNEKW
jgi:hypothetical protein